MDGHRSAYRWRPTTLWTDPDPLGTTVSPIRLTPIDSQASAAHSTTCPQVPNPGLPTKPLGIHSIHNTDDYYYFCLYPESFDRLGDDGRGYLPYCLTRR